jgi:small subunit ribosomal protein S18
MKAKKTNQAPRVSPKPKKCPFCEQKKEPSYKERDALSAYVTDRAKIVTRRRSGLCAKHQRKLAVAVKRLRHLGLLPFVGKVR